MSERPRGPAPYAWWIGARYLRARRDNRFVGFISGISMAGIALGVAVLIAVLSVMNGFERDLQARILGVVSHATLEGTEGRLDDWQDCCAAARLGDRAWSQSRRSSKGAACWSPGTSPPPSNCARSCRRTSAPCPRCTSTSAEAASINCCLAPTGSCWGTRSLRSLASRSATRCWSSSRRAM